MRPTDPTIDILRSHLGPRARALAVAGAPALAERLAAEVLDTATRERANSPLDACVWCETPVWCEAPVWCETPARPLDLTTARALRQQLAASGRLLILREHGPSQGSVQPALTVTIQDLVVTLSAAGFVLLKALALGPVAGLKPDAYYVLLVARVAPFAIRGYLAGDETSIAPLFEQSFQVRRPLDAWRWKFLEHPWGKAAISLAWDGKTLVGQYAGLPMRLVRGDGTEDLALQLCDIMTAPAVRGVGRGPTAVLSRLLRYLYATHGEHRIGFVIGFNTATSRAFALRFSNGHELEPVAFWRRTSAPEAAPEAVPETPSARYRVRAVEHFGARFDRFFTRVAPAYGYLQRRGVSYLSWRYRQPGVIYLRLAAYRFGRLVGWSIFRRREDTLVWGDALVDPRHPDAARALLEEAICAPENASISAVTAWFAERPAWWRETMIDLGFERTDEPNDLSIIYGIHSEPAAGTLLAGWHYTMGDSDLF